MHRYRLCIPFLLLVMILMPGSSTSGQQPKAKKKKDTPKVLKDQAATAPETLKVAKGFKVELLHTVPREEQGSWVNLCVDPKGRLITSDQYGKLYRITPPAIGGNPGATKIEPISADIGDAQGLLWAFDALYVMVNSGKRKAGLYRVTDSNGDDQLDKVELLRELNGGGEHGPHAILPHPDGKRLTVICGNQTRLTKYDSTRVPPIWGEDHLLPRLPDGNGFMRGVLGPGGAIYNVTPDGKNWELTSVGFRNQYDGGFNKHGDLFTYDADMEWDMNTPWYRPTRVAFASSGSEFGWRNGAGKYPAYYPDNLPGIINIGPGSPTGTCFGYGAKFPAKYQNAFFICDWSYGKLYAIHLKPEGASYSAEAEEFVTGTPLPLTDVVVNPHDGAMYFAIGGRRTQSGLYRVTYTGSESTAPDTTVTELPAEAKTRRELEAFHKPAGQQAVEAAWPHLSSPDRQLRFTARVVLEHQPVASWKDRALTEQNPVAATQALLALVRVSAVDPFHKTPQSPSPDPEMGEAILNALNAIAFEKLSPEQRLEVARVYQVLFNRFGKPSDGGRSATLAKLEPLFPTKNRYVDGELLPILVYLEAPSAAAKGVQAIASALTQEEQMEYTRSLRVLKTGWTPELRKEYFSWFLKAVNFRGGNSLRGSMKLMRDDALASMSEDERKQLAPVLEAIEKAGAGNPAAAYPVRPFVKKWTLEELAPKLESAVKAGGRNFEQGRKLFGEARCFGCHRYDNDGSSYGPDLTGVAGRFNPRDLLESIIDPNKEVSDQYAAVEIDTLDGKKVIGRIVNLNANNIMVNVDMLDPNRNESINRDNIERMRPAKQSMMPTGLLDVMNEDEVLDLMAYLLSRGDSNSPLFKK